MADDGGHGAHAHMSSEEKEKRRKKQLKRMGKILARVWALKGSEGFQEERHATSKEGHVLDLSTIGQKIDSNEYRLGRHGWEDFARDLGGVYNRHIHRYVTSTVFCTSFLLCWNGCNDIHWSLHCWNFRLHCIVFGLHLFIF